ncbi:hypothetical protein [Methylophaga sp.]|uniref:hypothetical protein n=1 Tax=Methylophaga sp. TaxID=2024840 RepID=UPI003A8D2812
MSRLKSSQKLCDCAVCSQKRKFISWLDSNSLSYKLSKHDWPITSEKIKKRYKREILLDLVRVMALQDARKDHDNEK